MRSNPVRRATTRRATTRRATARRAVATLAAIAVACGIGALCHQAEPTNAAFADAEAAQTELGAPLLDDIVLIDSYMPRTVLNVRGDGSSALIWGFRHRGVSGQGTLIVDPADPASEVTLPDGRTIDLIVGATHLFDAYTQYSQAVAALAGDGTVWTWGCSAASDGRRCGRDVPAGDKQSGSEGTYSTLPGQVTDFRPALAAGETIIDLKTTRQTFFVLTNLGNLYSWGESAGTGSVGQGTATNNPSSTNRKSPRPRRILTGVHSFGVGPANAWAVVTCGWSVSTWVEGTVYNDATTETQGTPHGNCTNATTADDVPPSLVFWGANNATPDSYVAYGRYVGGGQPAGSAASGLDATPVNSYYFMSPAELKSSNPLRQVFDTMYTSATTYAVGSDEDTGVRMGSAGRVAGNGFQALKADNGTFQYISGHAFGSQLLARDRAGQMHLYTWGYDGFYGAGHTANPLVPTEVSLGGGVTPVMVRHSRDMVFILDSTGSLWAYGTRRFSDDFPATDANGKLVFAAATAASAAPHDGAAPGFQVPTQLVSDDPVSPFYPGRAHEIACSDFTCLVEDTSGHYWNFGGGWTTFTIANWSDTVSDTTWQIKVNNPYLTVRDWWDCRNTLALDTYPNGLVWLHRDGQFLTTCP
ncbi:MAG: hypothetical protein LBR27_05025 [Bifidobacteriaceae bacterium]|jgi:hypothetical protein|nr:hypothetical protein [Bifidobacteriaceae bacterium]